MELGRLLGKSGSSSTWGSSGGGVATTNEVNGKSSSSSSAGKSQTPFIDATVEFLKEFIVVEENEKGRKKGNGNGFGKGGKGKEKEVVRDEDGAAARGEGDDEEDEWPQSFLPTYVYEAMKEKKRFESMRVSCPFPFNFISFVYFILFTRVFD